MRNTDLNGIDLISEVNARIANLEEADRRANAQIRIYCDNDSRWELRPDRPNDPLPNSQRTDPNTQEWVDERDHMSHYGRTCKTGPLILATTYITPYNQDGSDDATDHVTITVRD